MERKLILAIICFAAAVSCCPKLYPVEQKDSVRVEIRERIVHDTAIFVVEKEVEKTVTRDTISHLENTYAESDAVVSGGMLHHSLKTKPQAIKKPVAVVVHDTLTVTRQTVTIAKEIEKPLTRWQSFRIVSGDIFLGIILLAIIAGAIFLILKLRI